MIIPEVILHRVLVAGFQAIRRDPRILDNLFKQADNTWRTNLKDFILNNTIGFSFNYPRDSTPKLPSIIILLRGESEDNTFLGDMLGEYPNYGIPDEDMIIDTLGGHGASVSTLEGLPPKLVGGLPVISSGTSPAGTETVVLDDSSDAIQEFYWTFEGKTTMPPMTLYVVAGRGAGQTAAVKTISGNTLDLYTTFDPHLDSSSVVDLRLTHDPTRSVGEPPRVYDPNDSSSLVRVGANFAAQYQVEFIAGTPDEAIFLYSVVKAVLFSQKMFMESQGLQALKISGAELAPRSEYVPTEAFMRTMTLSFTYQFGFLEEQQTYNHITLDLAVRNSFTSVCEKIELRSEL